MTIPRFGAAMPALFVLLWSTGFIGAKFGLPYAEPFTFLLVRFVAIIALLAGLALWRGAVWPRRPALVVHLMVSGVLVHAVYLGGVFASIHAGLPSGLSALVVGLQPVLTALVAAPVLGERVGPRQWLGLVLGLGGVALVLSSKLSAVDLGGVTPTSLALAGGALVGITVGTLYQKRFCTSMDLLTGTTWQYVGALMVMAPLAAIAETMVVDWTLSFVLALTWLVLVLSFGAISLLMLLIKAGEASKVASLFYLVPPVTALMAWGLFGEELNAVGLAGMALAAFGVSLVVRK